MSYHCTDFAVDMRKCTSPDNYIWVNSGYSTCAPLKDTVSGVKGCFSPPFAAKDTKLSFVFEVNGHPIEDTGNKGKEDCGLLFAGAFWQPDKIIRKGTYHYMVGEKLLSVFVISELVPLYGKAGFLLKLQVKNRSEEEITLKIKPLLSPGHPVIRELREWDFMPPEGKGGECRETDKDIWENEQVCITLLGKEAQGTSLCVDECRTFRYAAVFTRAGEELTGGMNLQKLEKESLQAWERRMQQASVSIPEIKSNIPGLEEYYKRSLISGLVCLWENDIYVTNPFPATSGMDGGSICCYPWDVAGYSARTLIMLLGEGALSFFNAMLDSGIDSHITMAMTGEGLGWCNYAYSMWSLLHFYWNIVVMTGKGVELFDKIQALFEAEKKRLPEWKHLKDYGRQHNLLEMRTCGYEYYVASPNAERAWCYDRLADLAELIKGKQRTDWREKAEAIRDSIRENLWDAEKGWFKCIHPGNHQEYIYSIQAYDVLRMGACNEAMKKALLTHVTDGKFLGDYGVSSISAEDTLHYELNDPDWSGGGCYSGDGPELAETLWNVKEPELALDVLKRHFWMGTMALYMPQEHYCDRPMMPENKRANIIAGVSGLQAVLFGMLGLKPKPDGRLCIEPQLPEGAWCEMTGYCHRGKQVDRIQSGRGAVQSEELRLKLREMNDINLCFRAKAEEKGR